MLKDEIERDTDKLVLQTLYMEASQLGVDAATVDMAKKKLQEHLL